MQARSTVLATFRFTKYTRAYSQLGYIPCYTHLWVWDPGNWNVQAALLRARDPLKIYYVYVLIVHVILSSREDLVVNSMYYAQLQRLECRHGEQGEA